MKLTLRLLVVDSNNFGLPEARLPQVLRSLGRYGECAAAYPTVKSATDGNFHDLTKFDLALVHEGDARKDNGAFYKLCWKASTPCAVFSGGFDQSRAESERLLLLSDSDLLRHAEDGVAFLVERGQLSLTAWTKGMAGARQAELARVSRQLKIPFMIAASGTTRTLSSEQLDGLIEHLRSWSASDAFQKCVDEAASRARGLLMSEGDASPTEVQEYFRVLERIPGLVS